ncbi:DUF4394 domain-containing protein [Ramlibacter tataouinensis]|uniref:DUF4394 domain-containing protein n=1 Tax=Ramlibacter tataouinensis (strain ATCC BAA-407 / DSM 14655 / LMG 21543 / TTB310) TaxID=365046 RepID=F5Y4J4_RAMTT|nr:DUF4394 domain-containing protein [Ramlibacter tataouinensis]AEG91312.1 Conserved hypothetical protein [Ramlibacter tataouinensis TTB310]
MQAFIPFSILGAVTLAIAGCGGGDDDGDGRVGVGDTVVITTDNQVRSFNRNNPDNVVGRQSIQGLASGETLVGIDYRPANRQLYALGNRGGIYTLDPATGRVAQVSTLRAAAGDDNPYTALSGSQFGIDFNPVADRLRVVSDTGQNLRINVDTGDTTTDGPLAQGNPGITATPAITAAAYTNSVAGATSTTLYVADLSRGALQVQNPPNDGTLDTGVGLGVTGSAFNGFDIESTGTTGYLAVQSNVGVTLYRVSLTATNEAAQRVGLINTADRIVGLALVQPN